MSSAHVVKDDEQWPEIAEALDVLGAAANLSAFAEQHDKMQHLFGIHASLTAAPFYPQLLTALTHVVSSALHLVHQTSPRRLKQLPTAAVGCLLCCIDTYIHLIKAAPESKPLLRQLRTDIAESGLLQAMTKAATKLKTAAPRISLPRSSAATAETSSNPKAESAGAAAKDASIAARDQSRGFSGCEKQSAGHSAPAIGSASEAAVPPASAAAEEPHCKLSTAAAQPVSYAAPNDWPAAGAAAYAHADAAHSGGKMGPELAVATAVTAADPHTAISKGVLLLYPNILIALLGVAAPDPNTKHLPAVTLAVSGLAVVLLQLHDNATTATAPPPVTASPPVTATAMAAPVAKASPPLAQSAAIHSTSEWISDLNMLVCISWCAHFTLLAHHSLVSGVGGNNPGDVRELCLSIDVVQLALWVAASAADALQPQDCSSHGHTQTAESSPSAASTQQPTVPAATPGSLGVRDSHTSSSILHTPSPGEAVIGLLPWSCKARVYAGQAQQHLLASLSFLSMAFSHGVMDSDRVAAAPYGVHPSAGPGFNRGKVLDPQLVAPLLVMVMDVFVSQPVSPQHYETCAGLLMILSKLMWDQATLLPKSAAAAGFVSIVRPLLCKLLPHMQHVLKDPVASGSSPEPALVQRCLLDLVFHVLLVAGLRAFPDSVILELANVFCDQPRLTAAALESALRSQAHRRPEHLRDGAVVVTIMRLVLHAIYGTPQVQDGAGLNSEPAVTATAAAKAMVADLDSMRDHSVDLVTAAAADPELAQQMFALMATGLKCITFCTDDHSRPTISAVAAAAAAISLSSKDDLGVLKYLDLAKDQKSFIINIVHDTTTEPASSLSTDAATAAAITDEAASLAHAATGAATDAEDLRPWIALAGRSLYVLGKLCNRSYWQQMASLDNQPAFAVLGRLITPVTVTFFCRTLVQWLGTHISEVGLQGEAAAAEKALQDLLSEQQELHTSLKAITSRMGPALDTKDHSTAIACVREFLVGPAMSVKQFGALVCAALPVGICCANPECQNVSESSELLQSSRCSGCKMVCYCSVDCQRQHWRLHRPVCARFKASLKSSSTGGSKCTKWVVLKYTWLALAILVAAVALALISLWSLHSGYAT